MNASVMVPGRKWRFGCSLLCSLMLFVGAASVSWGETFTAGVLTFDDSPGGTITPTGGGNATIQGPVLINGFMRVNSTITVQNGTVTFSGFTIPAIQTTFFLGAYTVNAADGALSAAPGASALVSNVSTFPCRGTIRANDLLLDYRSSRPELANTAFRNVSLSASGIGVNGAQFYTTGAECGTPTANSMVFNIGSVTYSTGQISYANLVAPNAKFSLLSVGSARLVTTGEVYASGLTFQFHADTDCCGPATTFAPGGFNPGGTISLPGDVTDIDFDNFYVPATGTPDVIGGVMSTQGMISTFGPVTFEAAWARLGTIKMYPGGGIGESTAENFRIAGNSTTTVVSSQGGDLVVRGVRFPFQIATLISSGLDARNVSIENGSGFDERFVAVNLDQNGMRASAAFEFAGLPYYVNSVTPRDPEGLTFNGFMDTPFNLLSTSLPGSFDAVGTSVRLTELRICSTGSGARIQRSMFALPQFCFDYMLGPPESMSALAEVTVPGVTGFGAGLRIFSGVLDRITVSLRNLNKPIGTTGATLQDIYATVQNLARIEREYVLTERISAPGTPPVYQERTVRGVPPVQFLGDVSVTGGPRILDRSLLRGDGSLLLDETQVSLKGTVTVVIFEVGGAYVHVVWSGPTRGTSFGGFMVYYSILRGNIDGFIGFDSDFSVCAGLALQIPEEIPIIGGIKLGNADVCMGAPPFRIGGTVRITIIPRICLGFLGCTPEVSIGVGFEIDEDGDFSIDRKNRGERFGEWEVPYFQGYPVYADAPASDEAGRGEFLGDMVFFTNFRQTDKVFASDGNFRSGPRQSQTTDLMIAGGSPVTVRLSHETPGGNPDFRLTAPGGKVYTSASNLAAIPSQPFPDEELPPAVYVANPTTRDASFLIPEPVEGIYQVEVLHPGTLGQFAVEVLTQIPPPVFEFGFNYYGQDSIVVQWDDEDPDSNANRIRIFIDTDNEGANGTLIGETGMDRPYGNIGDNNELIVYSSDVHLAAGSYWVYAIVEDGVNPPLVVYSGHSIFVPDVEAPPAVMSVDAQSHEGTVIVTWEPVMDPTVVSYKVQWTENPESSLFTHSTSVDAEQSAAFIHGLEVGKRYKFSVVAVRYAEMLPMRAAEKRIVLADAVSALRSARDAGTNNRYKRVELASSHVANAAAARSFELTSAEALSLSQQAAQLATPYARKILQSVPAEALAVRADNRPATRGPLTDAYAEGFRAQSDTVLVTQVPGTGAPIFVGDPATSVFEGERYVYQAVATGAEGETITYAKIAGPAALTVSPEGAVTWQTAIGDAELHDVEIAATDSIGRSRSLAWRISVSQLRPNARLRINPPPSIQVFPGQTWTYQPTVEGLFQIPGLEDQEVVSFVLTDAPLGMVANFETGVITWTTTMEDIGSHRVILLVTQRIEDQILRAVQVLEVNVETASDDLESVVEQNLKGIGWFLN